MTYDTDINDCASDVDAPSCSINRSKYRDRLKRWAIVHLLPDQQPRILAHFRSRSDADGHLKFLHQKFPGANFVVIFDKQET